MESLRRSPPKGRSSKQDKDDTSKEVLTLPTQWRAATPLPLTCAVMDFGKTARHMELKNYIIKELEALRTQANRVLRFHSRTKTVSKLCTSPDMLSLRCPRL